MSITLAGLVVLFPYFRAIRIYIGLIILGAWVLIQIHKHKRKQGLKELKSLREKISSGHFSNEEIPVITYLVKESIFNRPGDNFESLSNHFSPGFIFGTKDLPFEILANRIVGENKLVLVIEAEYEDPDIMSTGVKQKFALVKTVFIEFAYCGESKYSFRSPYFTDNPEKSLFRKVVFQLEDHLLKPPVENDGAKLDSALFEALNRMTENPGINSK
jgi:hypothetical protein